MKYLFFDIECSNCFGGKNKICEIGYVLTDENFNILLTNDIPMSPGDKRNRGDRFDTSIYKREPGFEWAYDFDYYFECPKFPYYYKQLKKLFEDEETMVFGYSVDNDVRYLDSEFTRYGLDPFRFNACDIQKIMKYYSEKKERFMGLQDAFKKLCPVTEFIRLEPHLSRDDAYMSMRVLQEMLKNLEMSVEDLLEICPDTMFNANEYLQHYHERKEEKEKIRASRKKIPSENQVLWGDFYRSDLEKLESESSIGKICTISKVIKEDKDILLDVIDFIKRENFVANDRISGSDFIIVLDEEDKERMASLLRHPFNGKYILYDEIKNCVKS